MSEKLLESSVLQPSGKLFILAGSSGAGKTTLSREIISKLKNSYNCDLSRVITYTTKPPRVGELTAQDYHYIGEMEFKAKIAQNFFLEWSCAYGAYYGSPRDILEKLKLGSSLILIVDQAGVSAIYNFIQKNCATQDQMVLKNSLVYIWIETNLATLEQRLRSRSTEPEVDLQRRLSLAQQEILIKREKLGHIFNYSLLNENSLNQAIADLEVVFKHELALK
jgi:guanylate kinase